MLASLTEKRNAAIVLIIQLRAAFKYTLRTYIFFLFSNVEEDIGIVI